MLSFFTSNIEFLVEARRDDLNREIAQMRLEREAMSAGAIQPNLLQRMEPSLGRWMVSTGERWQRRYEASNAIPRWYQSFRLAR